MNPAASAHPAAAERADPTSGTWAVQVTGDPALAWAQAAALRLHPGIEAVAVGDGLWLRGDGGGSALAGELRRLGLRALARRDGRAWHPQAPLPVAILPQEGWRALRAATLPALPDAALPPAPTAPVAMRLVPGEPADPAAAEAAAMLLPLAELAAWAGDAPEHRLERLRFACSDAGEAVVVGTPLPPLPGRRCWRHGQALLPCGLVLAPPCPAAGVAEVFALGADELALVLEDRWHRLTLVAARRAALRQAVGQHPRQPLRFSLRP
jgi:hypothetical protein